MTINPINILVGAMLRLNENTSKMPAGLQSECELVLCHAIFHLQGLDIDLMEPHATKLYFFPE